MISQNIAHAIELRNQRRLLVDGLRFSADNLLISYILVDANEMAPDISPCRRTNTGEPHGVIFNVH
jgi:hypothetical protein